MLLVQLENASKFLCSGQLLNEHSLRLNKNTGEWTCPITNSSGSGACRDFIFLSMTIQLHQSVHSCLGHWFLTEVPVNSVGFTVLPAQSRDLKSELWVPPRACLWVGLERTCLYQWSRYSLGSGHADKSRSALGVFSLNKCNSHIFCLSAWSNRLDMKKSTW